MAAEISVAIFGITCDPDLVGCNAYVIYLRFINNSEYCCDLLDLY